MRKNRNYWNKEMCIVEAKKYKTRTEFSKNSSVAYETSRKNMWLDDVCKHMEIPHADKYKWSFEICQKLASAHKHRKEFQNEHKNAYYSAMHNGWLDDICRHMEYQKLPNRYWHSFENCKKEALKYNTKSEFINNSQHAYNISVKNGWISDICKHMTPIGNRYNKCIYSYEFPNNYVYVGLMYNMEIREKSRKYNKNDAVTKYILENNVVAIRKQLTDYVPVGDAIKLEKLYLDNYIKAGWVVLNRRETGGIGSRSHVWNINRIKKIIGNYKTLEQFRLNEKELYDIANGSGWINSLFPIEI